MNIIESIENMERGELLKLAATQGVKVHHRAKDDTIRRAIVESISTPQQIMQQPKPNKPRDHNTPEQVEAAIAKIKEKVPKFVSHYDTQSNTWHFKCKGAEECGNLDIPLRVIVMKATTVSKGRVALIGLTDYFDKTTATGKSAYTNPVLTA